MDELSRAETTSPPGKGDDDAGAALPVHVDRMQIRDDANQGKVLASGAELPAFFLADMSHYGCESPVSLLQALLDVWSLSL